jgi:hypothetical protein
MRKALKIGETDTKIIFLKPQYSCLSFNRRFVLLNDNHWVVVLPNNRQPSVNHQQFWYADNQRLVSYNDNCVG